MPLFALASARKNIASRMLEVPARTGDAPAGMIPRRAPARGSHCEPFARNAPASPGVGDPRH
jgi:hypothetical protein